MKSSRKLLPNLMVCSCSCSRLLLLLLCTLCILAYGAAAGAERGGRSQRRGGGGGAERRLKLHRIQHGGCSYTFMLPELRGCQAGFPPQPEPYGGSTLVQRDSPSIDWEWSARKLQHLERKMENNTQWLQKVRKFSSTARGWRLLTTLR